MRHRKFIKKTVKRAKQYGKTRYSKRLKKRMTHRKSKGTRRKQGKHRKQGKRSNRKSTRVKSKNYSSYRGGAISGHWDRDYGEIVKTMLDTFCAGSKGVIPSLLSEMRQRILQVNGGEVVELAKPYICENIYLGNHLCEKLKGPEFADKVNSALLKREYIDNINQEFSVTTHGDKPELRRLLALPTALGNQPRGFPLLVNLFQLTGENILRDGVKGTNEPLTVISHLLDGNKYQDPRGLAEHYPESTTLIVTHGNFLRSFINPLLVEAGKPPLPLEEEIEPTNLDCIRVKMVKKYQGPVRLYSLSYHSSESFTKYKSLFYDTDIEAQMKVAEANPYIVHTFIFMRHCPACHNAVSLGDTATNLLKSVLPNQQPQPMKGSTLTGEASMCFPIMIDHMFAIRENDFVIKHFIRNVLDIPDITHIDKLNFNIVCSTSFRTALTAECMNLIMAFCENEELLKRKYLFAVEAHVQLRDENAPHPQPITTPDIYTMVKPFVEKVEREKRKLTFVEYNLMKQKMNEFFEANQGIIQETGYQAMNDFMETQLKPDNYEAYESLKGIVYEKLQQLHLHSDETETEVQRKNRRDLIIQDMMEDIFKEDKSPTEIMEHVKGILAQDKADYLESQKRKQQEEYSSRVAHIEKLLGENIVVGEDDYTMKGYTTFPDYKTIVRLLVDLQVTDDDIINTVVYLVNSKLNGISYIAKKLTELAEDPNLPEDHTTMGAKSLITLFLNNMVYEAEKSRYESEREDAIKLKAYTDELLQNSKRIQSTSERVLDSKIKALEEQIRTIQQTVEGLQKSIVSGKGLTPDQILANVRKKQQIQSYQLELPSLQDKLEHKQNKMLKLIEKEYRNQYDNRRKKVSKRPSDDRKSMTSKVLDKTPNKALVVADKLIRAKAKKGKGETTFTFNPMISGPASTSGRESRLTTEQALLIGRNQARIQALQRAINKKKIELDELVTKENPTETDKTTIETLRGKIKHIEEVLQQKQQKLQLDPSQFQLVS